MENGSDLASISIATVAIVHAAREAGMPVRYVPALVLTIGAVLGAAMVEVSVAGALAGVLAALGGSGGYSLTKTSVEATQARKRRSA